MSMPTQEFPSVAETISKFVLDLVRAAIKQIEAERADNPEPLSPALFNRKEAAKYLAIGVTTLDYLKKSGQIETVVIGKWPKYTRKELDRYVEHLTENAQSASDRQLPRRLRQRDRKSRQ
jgi:hypothetical protein